MEADLQVLSTLAVSHDPEMGSPTWVVLPDLPPERPDDMLDHAIQKAGTVDVGCQPRVGIEWKGEAGFRHLHIGMCKVKVITQAQRKRVRFLLNVGKDEG